MKYKGAVSVVIPIYNESLLLHQEITKLIDSLQGLYLFEVILVENGSTDNTYGLAMRLAKDFPAVRVFRLTRPSYGKALQTGISHARHPFIIQLDLDLVDPLFIRNAYGLLCRGADIVVGSKLHRESVDRRSSLRLLFTRVVNLSIRVLFSYPGSDTHGIKAYRKEAVIPFFDRLPVSNHFFDTALLLAARKKGLRIVEVPVKIVSLRSSRFPMKIRIIEALGEFYTLFKNRAVFDTAHKVTFTADDYGLCEKMTRSIERMSRANKLYCVSVLATHASKRDMERLAHGINTALHINLVEGKPVMPPDAIPTLVNAKGEFYPLLIFYTRLILGKIDKREIKAEIEAQIRKLAGGGRKISELNSHQHVHALAPVGAICMALAKKWRIPRIRNYDNVHIHSLHGYANRLILQAAQLPFRAVTVRRGDRNAISFMSWETSMHTKPIDQPLECVIHPGSSFDKNNKFMLYLS